MRELFLKRDGLLWMMFLRRYQQAQSSGVWKIVTGTAPLTLEYALPKAIKSLIQYGKCTQDGTPTSEDPVDIVCNNGALVAVDDELPLGYKRIESIDFDGDFWYETGASLRGTDDVTLTLADTTSSGQNVFGSYNGTPSGTKNFSLYLYGGGSSSNCYFRYGEQLVRPRYGSGQKTITFGESGTSGFTTDVTVTPDTFVTAANAYIGMLPNSTSPAFTGSIIGNILVSDRLKYIPCERTSDGVIGYYEAINGEFIEPSGTGTPVKGDYDTSHCTRLIVDGTPEVLTITADGATTQTATVEDLFAVGDYKDEQDLITGVVTRRVAVCVYDGTQTIGNTFLSTTGGKDIGAIIVYPLDEPITEQVTAQPLSTNEGTNTISVTAEVSDVSLEVQYKGEFVKTVTGSLLHIVDALAKPAKKFVATLEPIQDLHGQDAPYPSGGGKNLFGVDSRVSQTTAQVIYTSDDDYVYMNGTKRGGGYANLSSLTLTLPVGTYYAKAFAISGTATNSISIYPYDGSSDVCGNILNSEKTFTLASEKTFYFRFAVWDDGTVFTNYKIGIVISATSGIDKFYPYSNICPITGHTGANVVRTGKNLLDMKAFDGISYNVQSGTQLVVGVSPRQYIDNLDGSYTVSDLGSWESVGLIVPVKRAGTYNVSMQVFGQPTMCIYAVNENFVTIAGARNSTNPVSDGRIYNYSWSLPEGSKYLLICIAASNANTITIKNPVVQYNEAITAYEPFGTTIPITFPDAAGTVYGGTLTINEDGSGVLAITDANIESYNGETLPSTWISDRDVYAAGTTPTTGAQVVYKLATPITYTLTSQQVLTLLKGENNIWVNNSDNLVLDYLAKAGSTP